MFPANTNPINSMPIIMTAPALVYPMKCVMVAATNSMKLAPIIILSLSFAKSGPPLVSSRSSTPSRFRFSH